MSRAVLTGLVLVALAGCGSSDPESTSTSAGGGEPAGATKPPGKSGGDEARKVAVPKLVGKSFDAAVRDVRRAGLYHRSPGFTGTVGNPRNEGSCLEILSQAPPAGTRVPVGDTVSIIFGACRSAIIEGRTDRSGEGG